MTGKNDEVVTLIYEAKNLSSEELYKLADDLENLTLDAKRTERAIKNLQVDSANLASFEKLRGELGKLEENLVQSRVEYKKLNDALKNNKSASDDEIARVERSRIEVRKNQNALASQRREYEKLRKTIRPLGVTTKNVADIQERLRLEMARGEKRLIGMTDAYNKQADVLREKTRLEREALASLEKQKEAEKKLAKVYSDAASDRLKSLNAQIQTIKRVEQNRRLAAEAEEKSLLEKRKELARTTSALADYEKRLSSLIEERRAGTIGSGDYIRKEAEIRESLKLTASQIRVSKRALEEESKALSEKIRVGKQAVSQARRQREEEASSLVEKRKIASEQERVTSSIKDYERALKNLYSMMNKGKISRSEFILSEEKLRRRLKLTAAQVRTSAKAIKASSSEAVSASHKTDLLTSATRRLAQAYTVLIVAQKAIEGVGSTVSGYGDLEAAITKVEKTTGIARDKVVELQGELSNLASESSPTATNELLRYAEVAGQLGASSSEDILKLASAADALQVSTNLAGDEAITLLSRILKMTGEGLSEINGLSSSVVELGNNMAVTESEIVEMTKEIVTGTTAIKLGSSAAAGYGAVLREMGETGERSRSAFMRLSQVIERASLEGGEQMERLGLVTGMTGDQIREALGGGETNKVLLSFFKGLSRISDSGKNAGDVLRGMGITANESIGVMRKLADNSVYLSEVIERSNAARIDELSHIREAAKAYADQNSMIARLTNRFTSLTSEIGKSFSDEVLEGVGALSSVIERNEESVIDLMEGMVSLGSGVLEVVDSVSSLTNELSDLVGTGDLVDEMFQYYRVNFNKLTRLIRKGSLAIVNWRIDMLSARDALGLLSDEGVNSLAKLKNSANNIKIKIKQDGDDIADAISRYWGLSSEAYEDLTSAVSKYSDAVDLLSDSQKRQLEQVVSGEGYVKGKDAAYRNLTAAIIRNQRVVEQEAILLERKAEADKKSALAAKEKAEAERLVNERAILLLNEVGKSNDELLKRAESLRLERDSGVISLSEYTSAMNDLALAQSFLNKEERESVSSSDDFFDKYDTASDDVFRLASSIRGQESAILDLNKEMMKAGKTTKELFDIKLKLKNLEEGLAESKRELAYIQEVENLTLDKLLIKQRANLDVLEALDERYRLNKITAKEYADAKGAISEKIEIINNALGDNTDLLAKNAEASAASSKRKKELADEAKRASDAIDSETVALRSNTEALQRNNKEIDRRNNYAEMRSDQSSGTPEAKALIDKIGLDEYNKKLNALISDNIGINGVNSAGYRSDLARFEREQAQAYREQERAKKAKEKEENGLPGVGGTTNRYVVEIQGVGGGRKEVEVVSERDANLLLSAISDLGEVNLAGVK